MRNVNFDIAARTHTLRRVLRSCKSITLSDTTRPRACYNTATANHRKENASSCLERKQLLRRQRCIAHYEVEQASVEEVAFIHTVWIE